MHSKYWGHFASYQKVDGEYKKISQLLILLHGLILIGRYLELNGQILFEISIHFQVISNCMESFNSKQINT